MNPTFVIYTSSMLIAGVDDLSMEAQVHAD